MVKLLNQDLVLYLLEKNSDKKDSLFLGNLNITPSNSAKGSIIWRMNVDNELDCRNSRKLARASNSSLQKMRMAVFGFSH